MDPQLIAAGAKVISAALTPAPAAPSYSTGSATFDNGMRNDSWTVTTSGSRASIDQARTDNTAKSASNAATTPEAPGLGMGSIIAMAIGLLFLRS